MHLIQNQLPLSPTTEAQSVVATDTTGSSTGIPDSVNEIDLGKILIMKPRADRLLKRINSQVQHHLQLITSNLIFLML